MALGHIQSIGSSAQQHGSVYWRNGAERILHQFIGGDAVAATDSLSAALASVFAVQQSPIWMDSSTAEQVRRRVCVQFAPSVHEHLLISPPYAAYVALAVPTT